VNWTIAFDGRRVGHITGRTPKEFKWYASVGQQEITSTGPIPTVGQRLTEVFEGPPVFRPLVANSQPYFQDPESWKPAKLSSRSHQTFPPAVPQKISKGLQNQQAG
jgi:hypothetical protein